MNKVTRIMILCFLFLLPLSIYASGDSDKEFKTIPVDMELMNITEQELFNDMPAGLFVFLVLGEGYMEGMGDFSYASTVCLEPSEPLSFCGDEDLSSTGMGTTVLLFPGKGVLKLEISECEQCMNLGTGEFKVNQREIVVQGSGALEGSTGEWNLEVAGQMGAGQRIHITGELNVPVN